MRERLPQLYLIRSIIAKIIDTIISIDTRIIDTEYLYDISNVRIMRIITTQYND